MTKMWEFLIIALYLAMIFVMVRPRSQGPKLVDSATKGVVNLVKAATGGGTW